jgi:RimJ/RimL family protein N-acetyltransferase
MKIRWHFLSAHMVIETPRLSLLPITPAFLEACLAKDLETASAIIGLRLEHDWVPKESTLQMRLDQLREGVTLQPWLLRGIALRKEEVLIGYIGFHGPPGDEALRSYAPDGVEIGYTVSPHYRRRGYATEACQGLMKWALETYGVSSFVLSISPENEPSLGVARKLGFEKVGSQIDEEDGIEDIYLKRFAQD